ncbi:DnaJ molecular chaperone y domain [Halocaridina rubra]|uniref:DnaJ molecular chaperone y domain n=1 Tax=Halocaridina rubra TaxID=373956 RepID=A0AAN8WJH3_HALRR
MQGNSAKRVIFSKRLILSSICWNRYLAARLLSTARTAYKTHYETLGLERECSSSDIREAFIRLSKEVHPDKNPHNPSRHQQFIQLNEAYSVLSRPEQRRVYDAELLYRKHTANVHTNKPNYDGFATDAPPERVIFRDESLWEHRDRSKDKYYEGRPYYGVPGVKKLPNSYIVFGIIVFTVVGAIFHFFLAKKASEFTTKQLDKRDQLASMHYMKIREAAKANGNELQKVLFRQRNEADNPRK